MSKLITIIIVIAIWYNVIAFVALDINFINWSWFERAALIVLCIGSLSVLAKNDMP